MSGIPKGKFPKTAHLLKHADFQRVYKQGRRHFSGNMTVFYLSAPPVISLSSERSAVDARLSYAQVRFGFTVPRALGGAVDRNRIRRRVREAVRRHMNDLEGVTMLDVVINPKRTALDAEFDTLSTEVARAFQVIRRNIATGKLEEPARQVLQVKDPQ